MTTKAPSAVKEFPPSSVERIAYASVESIATREPNDRHRLGYHIWRWLLKREGTLEQAVIESGARLEIGVSEAAAAIRASLEKSGATL